MKAPDFEEICTPSVIRNHLAYLVEIRRDDESAHGYEDDLHQYVLKSISDGNCISLVECCKLALKSKEIDFERWCS